LREREFKREREREFKRERERSESGDEKRGMKERVRSFKVKELRSNQIIHSFILLRSKQRT